MICPTPSLKGGEYIVEIVQLLTSIVSLCSSILGLTISIYTFKKLIIEEKEKNPQSSQPKKDSKKQLSKK